MSFAESGHTSNQVDHLIIGSGIAGLTLALKLANAGRSVLLIAKDGLNEGASLYAQGGIASVFGKNDSFDQHENDTIIAGAGLCHKDIVRMVVAAGPAAVQELIEMGVAFTREEGNKGFPFHLTREGGHSNRRVIHAGDTTGAAIMSVLVEAVRQHAAIEVREYQLAVDLITTDKHAPNFASNRCLGAYIFDRKSKKIYNVRSRTTYLCTGGHGRVYLYTSNPRTATGDGLAMGWRAGCKVANLEFMQFHPTCLYHPGEQTFLISEAVRGEGGVLKDHTGKEFMDRFHPLGSLAPRDVVARAIDATLRTTGKNFVYLDARHLGRERILKLFPNISARLASLGLDMVTEMVPVVPAAHYSCGGLVVDHNGQTRVHGLYALGEVACTGLHGGNRLASNSLLEALVFSGRAAKASLEVEMTDPSEIAIPDWQSDRIKSADELNLLSFAWDEIRRLMWHYVGIVRSDHRLRKAHDRILALRQEIDQHYWQYELTENLIEVRNLCHVATLTIQCAMARKESRGIHYNLDYQSTNPHVQPKDTIIW